MQPTEPFEVHLPKDILAIMNKAVASGKYPTADDIVCAALLQWQAWDEQPLQNIEELRALIDEGEASGDAKPFTLEELLAEIRKPA